MVAEKSFPIDIVAPWRDKQPLTGGMVAQWLRMESTELAFRKGLNRKSSIFTSPKLRSGPGLRVTLSAGSTPLTRSIVCSQLHSRLIW
ncbi:hypothetical protein [Nitrosomonas mobilis]|uniref:hypothetical protein n=1 Tax=Nitrosomonas mobilis TaxID=51642 RepID=UPI00115FB5F6|nr:hypothetical protein [Nitrosomonas mobilis]